MSLRELRFFTLSALMLACAFWPAACFSVSPPVSPDVASRPKAHAPTAALSRPGTVPPGHTPWKEVGNLPPAGLPRASSSISILGRDADTTMARAEGLYEVTAYAHTCTLPRFGPERPPQRGANGRWPVAGVTVAADASLYAFGTELLIEGLGFRTVGDRGHAIKGRRLDLFLGSCREARAFGRRWLRVVAVPRETSVEAAQ